MDESIATSVPLSDGMALVRHHAKAQRRQAIKYSSDLPNLLSTSFLLLLRAFAPLREALLFQMKCVTGSFCRLLAAKSASCHSERSEESRFVLARSFAALRMT
jgi:hypothetical protein